MASLWVRLSDTFSRLKNGLVPKAPSGTGTTKYLREDGTWAVPSGGGGGSSTLADLEDVSLNAPSDGQMLSYNATSQKWENKTPSGVGHNYSTTEQVVGTWIDGKTIYEKTWVIPSINVPNDTWYGVQAVSVTNIAKIIDGCAYNNDGTVWKALSFACDSHQYLGMLFYYHYSGQVQPSYKVDTITLRYIKNTE